MDGIITRFAGFRLMLRRDKEKRGALIGLAVLLAAVFAGNFAVHLIAGDDLLFQKLTAHTALPAYLASRYQSWTGRISAEALLYLALRSGLVLYRFTTPLCLLLAAYSIARYFHRQAHPRAVLIVFLSFGLFNQYILATSVFWVTGSFNYLVPVSLALWSMVPFADCFFRGRTDFPLFWLLPGIPAALAASLGNEQAALVMTVLSILMLAYRAVLKQKQPAFLLALSVSIWAGTAVNLLSPGNALRWHEEMTRFPAFQNLSLTAHVKFGLYWTLNSVVNVQSILLLCLSLLPLLFHARYKGVARKLFYLFAALFCVFVSTLLICNSFSKYFGGAKQLFDFSFFERYYTAPLLAHGMFSLVTGLYPYLFWGLYLILMVYLICKAGEKPLLTLLLFLAAACTLVMMSFSPTIVASGERAMFMCSVIFTVILFMELQRTRLYRDKRLIPVLVIFYMVNVGSVLLYCLRA